MFRGSDARSLFRLWLALVVSAIGSGVSAFGLGVWVYQRTGSTTQFAMLPLASQLPAMLLAPWIGHTVDRFGRLRMILLADAVSALVLGVLALLAFQDALQPWHALLGCALCGIAASAHMGALDASMLPLAGTDALERVNGLFGVARALSIIAPVLAASLFAIFGLRAVLVADALTFVLSLAVESGARIPHAPLPAGQVFRLRAGWQGIRRAGNLEGLILFMFFLNLVLGIVEVVLTPLALTDADAGFLARVMLASGLGGVLGTLLAAAVPTARPARAIVAFGVASGAALLVAGVAGRGFGLMIGAFVYMTSYVIVGPLSQAIWQRRIPNEMQGRVFVVRQALTNAASPLAYVLAGPLVDGLFEPAMREGGLLAGTLGSLFGVGAGSGARTLVALMGLATLLAGLLFAASRGFRVLDAARSQRPQE